jgi:hypothetical protein
VTDLQVAPQRAIERTYEQPPRAGWRWLRRPLALLPFAATGTAAVWAATGEWAYTTGYAVVAVAVFGWAGLHQHISCAGASVRTEWVQGQGLVQSRFPCPSAMNISGTPRRVARVATRYGWRQDAPGVWRCRDLPHN